MSEDYYLYEIVITAIVVKKGKYLEYITSLAPVHGDGPNSLVISCIADYVSGKVTLDVGENDQYACVSLKESKKYPLIGGIYEELYVAEQKRKGKKVKWKPIEQVVKKKNAGKKNQHKKRQGR